MATERLILDIRTTGTTRTQREINRIGRSASQANRTLALLRATLVVVAGARVIGNFLALADSLTNIQNRLRLVTRSAGQLAAVQSRLFGIAQETRSSFEDNAVLFNRLARSTDGLGLTFNELLDISRGVNQAIAISGATAQEARNSLIQFSQGLASGALRGDELRSVSEQLPALANAIGKEFGIAGGELIAFAKANPGILTTERIIRAITTSLPEFNKQFQQIDITVSQAFIRFNNRLTLFIGNLSKSTQVGRRLDIVLQSIADNFIEIGIAIGSFLALLTFNIVIGQLLRLGKTGNIVFQSLSRSLAGLISLFQLLRKITLFAFLPLIAIIGGATIALNLLGIKASDVKDFIDDFLKGFREGLERLSPLFDTILERFERLRRATIRFLATRVFRDTLGLKIDENRLKKDLNDPIEESVNEVTETVTKGLKKALTGGGTDILIEFGKKAAEIFENLSTSFLGIADSSIISQIRDRLFKFIADTRAEFKTLSEVSGGEIRVNTEALEKEIEAVFPLIEARRQLNKITELLNGNTAALNKLGLDDVEVKKRLVRENLGLGISAEQAAERIKVLTQALEAGQITQQEFGRLARENLRDSLDNADNPALAGLEIGFLNLLDTVEDVSGQTQELLERAFKGAEDAVVDFVRKGKIDLNSFVNDIAEQFLRLGTRQLIAGIGTGLGFGAPGSTGGLFGNLFGGLFGSGGAGPILGPFQRGGEFTVGPQNSIGSVSGVDNRVVAFTARDGEKVRVAPEGESGRASVVMNFNFPNGDADSIRRNKRQIEAQMSNSLQRASRSLR